jgi:hypothetical protein
MGYSDDELVAIARRDPTVQVLLADPAYARGGGLMVVIDPLTGRVDEAIRQL